MFSDIYMNCFSVSDRSDGGNCGSVGSGKVSTASRNNKDNRCGSTKHYIPVFSSKLDAG